MSSEHSAGGVVRRGDDVLVIVPHRRAADGTRVLGLPKGHLDSGENAEQAAAREVREEGGVETELVEHLGEVEYTYRRGSRLIDKRVSWYLFDYTSGDPADHDHEIEEARWMPLAQAAAALTYEGEREMVLRALSKSPRDR